MNIYKVSQSDNTDYDSFDSFIAAAESEEEARDISPRGGLVDWDGNIGKWEWTTKRENVEVWFVGVAKEGMEKGVILASFNAG